MVSLSVAAAIQKIQPALYSTTVAALATRNATNCNEQRRKMPSSSVKIGIIGGTGFEDAQILEDSHEERVNTPFGQPSDALIHGRIRGVDCVLLSRHGRGHSVCPSSVPYRANLWALKQAGCTHVLCTTACGSLQERVRPGQPVFIDQFIDRTKRVLTSFHDGTPGGPVGVCHIPMHTPFCPQTRQILIDCATELGIEHHPTGTTVCIEGPRFSSRAESFVFKSWGASVVNMTTVPEVCLAKEVGLCYAAIALPTDYDCWHDTFESVSVDLVMKTFKENVHKATDIILNAIPKIAQADFTKTYRHNEEMVKAAVML